MTLNSDAPNPTPIWRFWVPMLFQTALILAVPAQAIYTQLTGKTVILQTVPVDPYELLRGYSQTLRYDISSQDTLRKLPGWQAFPKQQPNGNKLATLKSGTRFYVILKAPEKAPNPPASKELPPAWKPIAISAAPPSRLPANQIALKGIAQNGLILYGLETYYIPEDQREQINADLRAARKADQSQPQESLPQANLTEAQQKPPVVMEIKVNAEGDAIPISLWAQIGKDSKQQIRNYRF